MVLMKKLNLDLPATKNRPCDSDFDKQLAEHLKRLAKIVKNETAEWEELRRQREEIHRLIMVQERRITVLEEQKFTAPA